ncbi:MAG: hypothetical protein JWO36_6578 [Myxococcales bacterium]|nr:hypothetical protein [Myxococcales bacterium]
MRLGVIAIVLAVATITGRADVWQHAIETSSPDAMQDKYDFEMKSGDEQTLQANARGITYKEIKNHVAFAAAAYRAAALAKPTAPEPHYRLGKLLYSFFFECENMLVQSNVSILCSSDPTNIDRKHAEEVIAAWDAFEARAPLDPRLSVDAEGSSEILFQRAILHTKLANAQKPSEDRKHLEAATHDYEKILARADQSSDETIWSNLAETYMMIGRLDDAVDMYREALKRGGSASTLYGLAVALDRDERGAQARDLILSQTEESKETFHKRVMMRQVFFVPPGEEYYYFALLEEAYGSNELAIEYWQKYLHSPAGARVEFQARAKQHLDTLLAQRKKHPPVFLPPLPDELFR